MGPGILTPGDSGRSSSRLHHVGACQEKPRPGIGGPQYDHLDRRARNGVLERFRGDWRAGDYSVVVDDVRFEFLEYE